MGGDRITIDAITRGMNWISRKNGAEIGNRSEIYIGRIPNIGKKKSKLQEITDAKTGGQKERELQGSRVPSTATYSLVNDIECGLFTTELWPKVVDLEEMKQVAYP